MVIIDLRLDTPYPPLHEKTPQELFDFGLRLACALRNVQVRTPAGDEQDGALTLDGRLLTKKGVEVF